jgi:hypothetical protein
MSLSSGRITKYILAALVFIVSVIFVIKFSGPRLLRYYVESGMGDCAKQPYFCMLPKDSITQSKYDRVYLDGLACHKLIDMAICAPKDFTVKKQRESQAFYKKKKYKDKGSVVYLIYEGKDFFVNLFPQSRKEGITDNYEFIKRVMQARLDNVSSFNDAFFVIMKGIFTADLGNPDTVKMSQFKLGNLSGFINYNFTAQGNFFDCNIISKKGDFFKVYIKDKAALLDMDKVMMIISTVRKL